MIWGKLAEETCRMNLVEDDPCLCAVTYLDGEYKEENVEMMAWKTVKGSYPDTEHVKFQTGYRDHGYDNKMTIVQTIVTTVTMIK